MDAINDDIESNKNTTNAERRNYQITPAPIYSIIKTSLIDRAGWFSQLAEISELKRSNVSKIAKKIREGASGPKPRGGRKKIISKEIIASRQTIGRCLADFHYSFM